MWTRSSSIVVIAMLASAMAYGQPHMRGPRSGGPPPHRIIERLSQMSPEERELMLKRLPPERRAAVEERLREYEQLPPAARERLGREYSGFQQLPPEKQDEIRRMFRKFSEFPEERRRDLRRELMHLRSMPPDRRSGWIASDRFRAEYNEDERQLLEHLSETLPGPPPATASAN